MAGRVLIADSSHQARRALRNTLEADGFAVREADNVHEALERLRKRPYHVALVAIDLSGGAPALVDVMKRDPDLGRTVVVLLAEDLTDPRVDDALHRGAADALRKPVDTAEAVMRTHAALRVFELQHAVREGNEHLTELAATDHLTGLLTRRFLESHMRGLVAGVRRHGRALSVAMFDLDNFKEINDTHGHQVGDVVLRAAVDRMRSRLRAEDLLGRWGGDELVLVLPDTDLRGAATLADALRGMIAGTAIAVDAQPVPVTLSAGVAEWHDEGVEELLQRADAALYAAKAGGRNRVATGPLAGAA
jgi:two-component system, cell cycle response regulator